MTKGLIAVVIPCYRVRDHIFGVLQAIPPIADMVFCVDDACPDGSGRFIAEANTDDRVRVLFHDVNQGVGGAMATGYRAALDAGAAICVKLDGDGQMDPRLIPSFVTPVLSGACDYAKGNRFFRPDNLRGMPLVRLLGNAVLSFMTKLSTGYWDMFDPTNGYTAIHAAALREIPLEKLARDYFFESDMLFRLNIIRAVVLDVPMRAVYGTEESGLHVKRVIGPFLKGHARNLGKRIFYNYYLRGFSIGSLQLALGLPLFLFGLLFSLAKWHDSDASGVPASAGTVMIGAVSLLIGVQMLLSFLHVDIESVPRTPLPRIFLPLHGTDEGFKPPAG